MPHWFCAEHLEASFNNQYSLHECANAIFAWARAHGKAVDEVHLKDLPSYGQQRVGVVFETGERFAVSQGKASGPKGFETRLLAAFHGLIQELRRIKKDREKAGSECIRESKHLAKFDAAKKLGQEFARHFVNEVPGVSKELVFRLPSNPADPARLEAICVTIAQRILEAYQELRD